MALVALVTDDAGALDGFDRLGGAVTRAVVDDEQLALREQLRDDRPRARVLALEPRQVSVPAAGVWLARPAAARGRCSLSPVKASSSPRSMSSERKSTGGQSSKSSSRVIAGTRTVSQVGCSTPEDL